MLKRQKDLALIALVTLCFSAELSASVEVDMKLLSEKAGLCDAELDTGIEGRHCNDLLEYEDFLFKGNSQAYFNYHIKNGDINLKNHKKYLVILEQFNKVMERVLRIK